MKPYTKRNECNNDESLRRNWRTNKKCHRKIKDRPYKKIARRIQKRLPEYEI